MSDCILYPVPAATGTGYAWRWRSIGGRECASSATYSLFYDCVADAEVTGHVVDFEATISAASQCQRHVIQPPETSAHPLHKKHA